MLRRVLLLTVVLASLLVAGLPPGRPLADVMVLKAAGKPIDLKQYRGKPLVIAILSTSCGECGDMADLLKRVQSESAGLQVVGVVVEEAKWAGIPNFVKKHNLTFPVGYLELDDYRKLANVKTGTNVKIPILLFVDPKQMVRVQFFGDDPMLKNPDLIVRSTVRELMKEVPQTASTSGKQ